MFYIILCEYTVGSQKFAHTLQNLQNVNYFTKIRGIIQNACYFFYFPEGKCHALRENLMKTFEQNEDVYIFLI